MSFLEGLTDRIPSGDRLYLILAVVTIAAALVVTIAFVGFFLMPQIELRNENASQVAQVEQQVVMTRQSEAGSDAEELQAAVATRQAEADQSADVFFAQSQAASLLDRLYAYADDSEVEIVNLQNVPEREQEGEEEIKPVYDINAFQLQALGTVSDLLDFLSTIREASSASFVIDNVDITEGEGGPRLTLDFAIYTSPLSSRTSEESRPLSTPSPTPENLEELEEALDTAITRRDWEQAIRVLRQIGAIAPDYPELEEQTYRAYVEYGNELLQQGKVDEAETQFNLALGIRPDGEEALAGMARISFTPTPTRTALQQLEADLDAAWSEENWQRVISILEQIESLAPDYPTLNQKLYAAHVNYGYALVEQGKLVEARAAFSRALEINPEGGEAAEGLRRLSGDVTPQPPTRSPTQPATDVPATPQTGYVTYVVQPGDNLFRIALRYNTTVEAIMAANGLTTRTIHAGLELRIPVP